MRRRTSFAAFGIVSLVVAGCGTAPDTHPTVQVVELPAAPSAPPIQSQPKKHFSGRASWYGDAEQGKRTAAGEIFDANAMTAAHRTLPFNTWLHVTNLNNKKSVYVRINDRGPYIKGRVLDLSMRAATELGMKRNGVAPVSFDIVTKAEATRAKAQVAAN